MSSPEDEGRRSIGNRKERCFQRDYAGFPDSTSLAGFEAAAQAGGEGGGPNVSPSRSKLRRVNTP